MVQVSMFGSEGTAIGGPSGESERPVVAGVRALVGEPLRALATTGFTLDRMVTVRRGRVTYLTAEGVPAAVELDPIRLRRLDIPVEPGWVRCIHAGPCLQGTIASLTLELETAQPGIAGSGRRPANWSRNRTCSSS